MIILVLPFIVALIGLPIVPKRSWTAYYLASAALQFIFAYFFGSEQAGAMEGPFVWFKWMLMRGDFGFSFGYNGAFVGERLMIFVIVALALAIGFSVVEALSPSARANRRERKAEEERQAKEDAQYQGPRCVSCLAPIQAGIKLCPKCGWSQPS
jgi:hypothetical protein